MEFHPQGITRGQNSLQGDNFAPGGGVRLPLGATLRMVLWTMRYNTRQPAVAFYFMLWEQHPVKKCLGGWHQHTMVLYYKR
jgi:hypothetical protein